MKTVLGAFGKCRRNYSLPTLEVAGSNPASAANYGRVAQRIERVKISLLLVARCTTLTGGCRQDYIRSVIAGSIPAAGNGVNPANLAAHLFRSMADKCLGNYIRRRFESCPAFGG